MPSKKTPRPDIPTPKNEKSIAGMQALTTASTIGSQPSHSSQTRFEETVEPIAAELRRKGDQEQPVTIGQVKLVWLVSGIAGGLLVLSASVFLYVGRSVEKVEYLQEDQKSARAKMEKLSDEVKSQSTELLLLKQKVELNAADKRKNP